MNIEEKLEELSALVAVAMNVAPERFPSWSDGSAAHMAALGELWSEIRPLLKSEAAGAVDEKIRQMIAAFRSGETDTGQRIAASIYANLAGLR